MIITLDFSAPRKLSYDIINGIIFQLKMKDHWIYRHRKSTLLAVFSLIIKNETALMVDLGCIQKNFNIYDVHKYIELYGIPTCYSRFEMLKVRESVIQSCIILSTRGKEILFGEN